MELGFVEEADPKELTSPFFPSKVGGKPAWLDLSRVPSVETLSCSKCGKPLIHLLQIQSSSSSGDQEHHRTFFLFLCPDSKCHSPGDASSFMALRCEKKSVSESHNTSDNKEAHLISTNSSACDNRSPLSSVTNSGASSLVRKESDVTLTPLCIVCGGQGHKHCGRCKCTHYCSRDHQLHDWKAGHKEVCPELVQGQCCLETLEYDPSVGVVLPELEIVTEPEPASCLEEDKERSEEERMKEYQEYMGDGKVEEVGRVEELEKIANAGKKKDKQFRVFKKRISAEPTQVLRYERGGQPLYVSGERIPKSSDIHKCGCGADRTFELQVMPQLLYYLKLDQDSVPACGVDWGTLLIYTCSSDCCQLGPGYHQELVWKQDIS